MTEAVNRDLRAARRADTEDRILAAAQELFLARGYQGTTLADVAERAGLGARTVYVRFGTKAALFKRVVDVALVGDTAPVDVAHRPATVEAMSAPTLAARLTALVGISAGIMRRAGALFVVANQAEATEPDLAETARAARADTAAMLRAFWRAVEADGLLPPGADAAWLGDTSAVLVAADTYVHVSRTFGWEVEAYVEWLDVTLRRLTGPDGARRTSRATS